MTASVCVVACKLEGCDPVAGRRKMLENIAGRGGMRLSMLRPMSMLLIALSSCSAHAQASGSLAGLYRLAQHGLHLLVASHEVPEIPHLHNTAQARAASGREWAASAGRQSSGRQSRPRGSTPMLRLQALQAQPRVCCSGCPCRQTVCARGGTHWSSSCGRACQTARPSQGC